MLMQATENTDSMLVFTSLPDVTSAEKLAAALLEARLAACINIFAPCHSVYRWQGNIECTTETPLLIKTRAACYPALEAAIRTRHPYDVPEIIALPVTHGLPDYLTWLAAETSS